MESKVRSPHSNKLINIGGKAYNNLIKEGYKRADLIDYTNDPHPIFPDSSSSEEDEYQRLKKNFYKNPGVDPRNPNKRIYKNKKPFNLLVEEFGNPYKINEDEKVNKDKKVNKDFIDEKVKKDKKIKDDKVKNDKVDKTELPDLLFTLTNYLSPEDTFSLYVSNKDLQEKINDTYNKTKNQSFIPWLRNYLKEQYETQKTALEKERIANNLAAKQQTAAFKKRQAQIQKEIDKEEKAILKQRKADEKMKAEILKDEEKLRKTYEEQERARQFYQQFQPQQNVLQRLGIMTKMDWRRWLLANHPDKNNTDEELVRLVIEEGRRSNF